MAFAASAIKQGFNEGSSRFWPFFPSLTKTAAAFLSSHYFMMSNGGMVLSSNKFFSNNFCKISKYIISGLRVMFVCRQQFKLTLPGKCAQTLDLFGRVFIVTFLTNQLRRPSNFDFT